MHQNMTACDERYLQAFWRAAKFGHQDHSVLVQQDAYAIVRRVYACMYENTCGEQRLQVSRRADRLGHQDHSVCVLVQ